jgi:spermidine/putrescine transport system substrate-binding protein
MDAGVAMNNIRIAIASLIATAIPSSVSANTLNLLIWESYIDQKVIDRWVSKTGVDINQIFFDSGDKRDAILANPDSEIDLAVISETGSQLFGKKGELVELSEATTPSINTALPRWRERCGGYGVPYFWGTLGIVYRADKVIPAPTSWADLLMPATAMSGHIAMLNDHNDILVPPLILQGKSINASDIDTLKGAFAVLKGQSKDVITYDYVMTSIDNPEISANIYMALAYSGDQKTLNGKGVQPGPWRYVLPKEGSLIWVDCLAVNAKSPHRALALQFLDFMNSPENAAANAVSLGMPTANSEAVRLLPEGMRKDAEIFPPDAMVARGQFYEDPTVEAVQLRKRITSSLANFHDAQ